MKGCKSAAPTQQVTNQLKGLPESAENLTERQVNNTDASWPWVTASVYKHRALTCRITDEPQFGQTASASPLKRHLINALLFCLRKRQHVFRTPWLDVVVQKRGEENKKKLMTGHFHVTYRDTLSARSRWARQSTTRSRRSELNVHLFHQISVFTPQERWGWWSMNLDHSVIRTGATVADKASLIQGLLSLFFWRRKKNTQIWSWMKREWEKSSDKLHTHHLTQHLSEGDVLKKIKIKIEISLWESAG